MRILVTGGAGYIGSHTMLELLAEGHELYVIDNFVNSSPVCLEHVAHLSNHSLSTSSANVADAATLNRVFQSFKPEAVLHFAGLKAVSESKIIPVSYYEQNVCGTVELMKAMDEYECKTIVFSSSATVYGKPHYLPYDEAHPCAPVNPYGRTKYFIEQILSDWSATDVGKSAMLLRYFNPVGAHKSGKIGEHPQGIPNNLVPYIAQVAIGQRERLSVFGNDYNTPDGTGVRDYIHVSDLAEGHVAALNYAAHHSGAEIINLGSGRGHSVFEMVAAFERASGQQIAYEIKPRRAGDIDSFFADATKAKTLLSWQAKRGIEEMCQDVWRWQSENPRGFQ